MKVPLEGIIDNGAGSEQDAAANGSIDDGELDAAGGGTTTGTGSSTGGESTGATGSGGTTAGTSNGMPPDAGTTVADAGQTKDAGTNMCLSGTTSCGAVCVDLKSSAANCGRCGRACPGGQACNGEGACLAPSGCTLLSFENHDYFVCPATKQWSDARTACLGWTMDLVMIETAAESAFLKGRTGWLGFNDQTSEGGWRWVAAGGAVNGAQSTYTNWNLPDEPNNDRHCGFLGTGCNSNGEDCGELLSDGTWNDAECDVTRAFMCETY